MTAGPADRIELRGLRVLARCGATADERDRPQPLEVDLDLVVDLAAAAGTDELGDTVDYGRVCAAAEAALTGEPAALLEHLAGRVASAVLAVDDRVLTVEVAVRKPRPPLAAHLASAGVRLARGR